jgi:2-oxoisovalerate dehydrogenase E2 component (dihydrolipoyl transacylase)
MSDYTVRLPDVGEGVAEAEIVEWHVAVGDTIDEDDVIVDVMSDKATIELPSPVAGVVRWLAGDVGDVIAVGSDLVRIALDDSGRPPADGDGASPAEPSPAPAPQPLPPPALAAPTSSSSPPAPPPSPRPPPPPTSAHEPAPAPATATATPSPSTRAPASASGQREGRAAVTAAPAVRARARDLAVDLGSLTGTGPDGRITHRDLDVHLRAAVPAAARGSGLAEGSGDDGVGDGHGRVDGSVDDGRVDDVKVIGLRRNIAERMQASKRRIPHFTYVDEVDVTELERLRRELNDARTDDQPKLSVLPFLVRAVVVAARRHPEMNARFDDEHGVVHRYAAVHLGVAVQTDRGLMVPVVKHAGALDVWATASEIARLSTAARANTVTLGELTGSTITITSLGALGGIVSTPVINAPEVAIIGVNKIVDRPVYVGDALVRRQLMNLSSSFDHRVIDGADAAAFIQTMRRLLETPALLFVSHG